VGNPGVQLPALARLTAVRIVQEAVTNALRHSQTSRLVIDIDLQAAQLVIEVSDFGVGFAPATVQGGRGLAGMRQRVQATGGCLDLASAPGRGARVRAQIPLESGHAAA